MSINKFNSEGYYDPTAYEALTAIEKEEKALRAFRPIVYICSPCSGDVEANVFAAQKYSRFAVDNGYIPIARCGCSATASHPAWKRRSAEPSGKNYRLRYFTNTCEEV